MPRFIIFFQCFCYNLQVAVIVEEIGIACIYQQCFYGVLLYVGTIGLLNIVQVIVAYILLIRSVAFFLYFAVVWPPVHVGK